jgi:hypothetical protein
VADEQVCDHRHEHRDADALDHLVVEVERTVEEVPNDVTMGSRESGSRGVRVKEAEQHGEVQSP